MTPDALRCWLTLQRVPGVGVQAIHALLAHFTGVEAIFSAPRSALESVLGRGDPGVAHILAGPDMRALARDLEWLEQPDHRVLTCLDSEYPPLLRETAQPPPLLYVDGDAARLSAPQLAIVGARNPTAGGLENARVFARALAHSGLTITSGLALGIDGAAHRGALDAGGYSIAVLGTGIDHVYPAGHESLARAVAGRGALVSEFPIGTPPKAENFPRRNRVISGLSLGTLVVEAANRSGSLITARLAAEQGREVFAIPGSIHSPLSRGCHMLLREGAKLVETAEDILEELRVRISLAPRPVDESPLPPTQPTDARAAELLQHMGYDPVSIDTLVERSGLTAHTISSMLLEMELLGVVEACPGGKYVRV